MEPETLENKPGVFVLLEKIKGETHVIDFGFAKDLQTELKTTMKEMKLCKGTLMTGYIYLNSARDAEPLVEQLEHWYDNTDSCNIVLDEASQQPAS